MPPTPTFPALVRSLRDRAIDAELAALVWVLAESGLPVHVATADPNAAADLVAGLEDLVRPVHVIAGDALEDVLAAWSDEPARLGVVLVARAGRVVSAHWIRPPLRDSAGHLRPQGPAVLAAFDARLDELEHFAWGVLAELAPVIGRTPAELEVDRAGRAERLARLLATAH